MFLDIFIIWLVIYYILRLVRNNSRTIQIFKGIILVVVIDALAKMLGLKTLEYLMDMFVNWGFLAVIIIFHPEIRSILERIGKSNVFSRITTLTGGEKENLVDNIVTAVMILSKNQTGALISIEQSHSLEDFVATGTRMNSDVTAELLTSIFVTTTPLHDGAVIIQGDKIACASAYFPPTNLDLPSRYGARHRAAIGISEISDAVTIVVSEETGAVSIAESGKLYPVSRNELRNYLLRVICGEITEVRTAGVKQENLIIDDEENVHPAEKKKKVFGKLALRRQEAAAPVKIEAEEVTPARTDPEETPEASSFAEADEEARAAKIKLPHKKKAVPMKEEAPAEKEARMTAEQVKAAREASRKRLKRQEEPEMAPAIEIEPVLEEEKQFDTTKLDISELVGFSGELKDQFDMVENMASDSAGRKGGSE
ncbi:MAG: diadenylate cyclase CdaA [Solobacterium sp.]|nr:diadenylate cyclase CdaA [Solobacterium sp.]